MGTFRVINGAKVGGNVASYFCLSDGTVIHAVAGPLNAKQYLQELRLGRSTCGNSPRAKPGRHREVPRSVRKGHLERLASESGTRLPPNTLPQITYGPPPRAELQPAHDEVRSRAW